VRLTERRRHYCYCCATVPSNLWVAVSYRSPLTAKSAPSAIKKAGFYRLLYLISSTSAVSLAIRHSMSTISCPTSKSCRPIRTSIVVSTSWLCRAKTSKCSPLGPYWPENQFLTVRSFAPVHPATVLTCIPSPTDARRSAAAISITNLFARFSKRSAPQSEKGERTYPSLETTFHLFVPYNEVNNCVITKSCCRPSSVKGVHS
jgi:hypothetical protein